MRMGIRARDQLRENMTEVNLGNAMAENAGAT